MNNLRKLLCVLTALVLVAFALPSVAGNDKKQFSLNMAIVTAPPTAPPYTLTATITNTGNSTINSFYLSATGVTIVGVDQPSTGNATGPFPGTTVSVRNMHPLKSGDSLTLTLRVGACGAGVWDASAWNGSQLNGQSFNLVPINLQTPLACGNAPSGGALNVQDSLNPGCVTGLRGFYDKDGTGGNAVPYFVWNTVSTNGQLHFQWPQNNTGDPLATFQYTVCGSGPLLAGTQVSWLNTTDGTPAFIAAEACLVPDQLPAPYGTLLADVSATATKIAVNALSPVGPNGSIAHSASNFYIEIGTERMTVTGVQSDDGEAGDLSDSGDLTEEETEIETWTVVRAVGGTLAAAHPASPTALVMSTPLPLLPASVSCYNSTGMLLPPAACPYTPFNQAQMCIQATTGDAHSTSHSTTFIDIGDGVIRNP